MSVDVGWKVQRKWGRKPIADCVGQYPLEAASERDDKVTDKSFDLKSSDWKWTDARFRNGKLTSNVNDSILSLQLDTEALALIDPMADTGRFRCSSECKRPHPPSLSRCKYLFKLKNRLF